MSPLAIGVCIGCGVSAVIYVIAAIDIYRCGIRRGREIERFGQHGIVTGDW